MNTSKRPSLKEMAFEKLGFGQRPSRFRSQSFDSSHHVSHMEKSAITGTTSIQEEKEANKSRKGSLSHAVYIPDTLLFPIEKEKEKEKATHDKRIHRPQPRGTILYEVTPTDTLENIAAKFDTTPSKLLQLNKMSCRILCAGQVLYVPGPDYDIMETYSSPPSSPTSQVASEQMPLKVDLPMVSVLEKPAAKIPGHAERQTPVSSPTEAVEIEPSRRLTEEEAKKLDEECVSRFLKFNAKHITDGQGVVNGTLIVTPNAIMFDPSVHDPLVIENSSEKYAMVAAMDTIISAAIYRDLETMKIKGQANGNNKGSAESEVYHGKGSFCLTKQLDERGDGIPADSDILGAVDEKTTQKIKDTLEEGRESQCASAEDEGSHSIPETAITAILADEVEKEKPDSVLSSGNAAELGSDQVFSAAKKLEAENIEKEVDEVLKIFCEPSDNAPGENEKLPEFEKEKDVWLEVAAASNMQLSDGEMSVDSSVHQNIEVLNVTETGKDQSFMMTEEDESLIKAETKIEDDASCLPDDIPVVDVVSSDPMPVPGNSKQETQGKCSSLTEMSAQAAAATSQVKDPVSSSVIDGSPKIRAIVNYAAGFFQTVSGDKSSSSLEKAESKLEVKPPNQPTSPHAGVEYMTKRGTRVRVVSAVTMEDVPNLFRPVEVEDDLKLSTSSVHYEEPPLFLCLKVGKPKHKQVTYDPPVDYGKAKKPEYWFTVSQEKADQFYAFLLHWKPEIYGDDLETEARRLSFIVCTSEQQMDEELEILDEYFGTQDSISKDWEGQVIDFSVVTSDEIYRKKSLDVEETTWLPELIGETKILTNEHIVVLVEHLPGRTVGYSWFLIYNTDQHGFSLKTLYRDMQNYESPVLLVVRDTRKRVFGALISCPLKISDHFYGTGESFLFTFYPEFKIFRWTGENNFFVKGNQESLAIGAGKGHFGLWFDGDLYHGCSHPCDTFGNDILTDQEDFVVQAFEAWGFV